MDKTKRIKEIIGSLIKVLELEKNDDESILNSADVPNLITECQATYVCVLSTINKLHEMLACSDFSEIVEKFNKSKITPDDIDACFFEAGTDRLDVGYHSYSCLLFELFVNH